MPIAVAVIYGGVEIQNRAAVARRVDARSAEARAVLEGARKKEGEATAAREQAFALYREVERDADRREEAEATWSRALQADGEAEAGLIEASRLYEVALAQDPSRDDVRTRLGEVLYERALLAQRDARFAQQDELLQRLRLYDPDGTWQRAWATPMHLDLASRPVSQVRIARYEDRHGVRVLGAPRAVGKTPLRGLELEAGSYVLTLAATGHTTVTYPVLAQRATNLEVSIDLPAADEVPAGYVYVPPGPFLFGIPADEDARRGFLNTTPLHQRETAGYFTGAHEVTIAEWTAFLDDLPDRERAVRTPSVEEHVSGKQALQLVRDRDRSWSISLGLAGHEYRARWGETFHYDGRTRRAKQDWRRFPVTGVTAPDAVAYTKWLSASGALPGARLCTEAEWERAARGADRRLYPLGNILDPQAANIDETYGKDRVSMGPDEVGSFPQSNSPFGLTDMAGNAFEWTTSILEKDGFVARGGSFFYDLKSAQSVNRAVVIPVFRDVGVGFRVCASHTVAPK